MNSQITVQHNRIFYIIIGMLHVSVPLDKVRTQNFTLGWADPETIYNLHLILKIML
jgi:hypothetical protein